MAASTDLVMDYLYTRYKRNAFSYFHIGIADELLGYKLLESRLRYVMNHLIDLSSALKNSTLICIPQGYHQGLQDPFFRMAKHQFFHRSSWLGS
jgi:hypothetical protein